MSKNSERNSGYELVNRRERQAAQQGKWVRAAWFDMQHRLRATQWQLKLFVDDNKYSSHDVFACYR